MKKLTETLSSFVLNNKDISRQFMDINQKVSEFLPADESKIFIEWAFAHYGTLISAHTIMSQWNKRHADLFILEPHHGINSSFKRMIDFWKEHKKNEGSNGVVAETK